MDRLSGDCGDMEIVQGYIPGAIGRVTEMHGTYYHKHWGFNVVFESKIGTGLSEFFGRYDENRDGFWAAVSQGRIEGSIAIDGSQAEEMGAHLRWFIVSSLLRGKGVGNQLMETALSFCRLSAFKRVYLWTFEGLESARHLYEKAGFKLVEEQKGDRWGKEVNEQRFELLL